MAANWWTSTHRKHWIFSRERLATMRDELEGGQHDRAAQQQGVVLPDRRLMFIFLRDRLLQLGKRLHFRQQCVATALVYMHRYFLSTPMPSVNLYILVATAFYLASKTEESPHHIRVVAAEARSAWPDAVPGDISRLGEMEFCLISEMRSQLIVWHPYRTLYDLRDNPDLRLSADELNLAWCIINDSYMTDLPLTCPPHLIAIIAIFLAVIFPPQNGKAGGGSGSSNGGGGRPMDANATGFASMGTAARPGVMSGVLGNAMHQLPINPPAAAPAHVHASRTNDAASTIQTSDKFQNVLRFLVESEIDLHEMIQGTQEIISLYEVWEQYNEKAIKDAVARCLKSHTGDY